MVHQPGDPVFVFGGDLVAETKSVVHAVASGKEAAIALDLLFREGLEAVRPGLQACLVGGGPSLSMEMYLGGPRSRRNHRVVRYDDLNTDHFRFAPRIVEPRLLKEERLRSFAEIVLKIGANLASREAERCFNCGLCNNCDNCQLFCPDIAVICDRKAGSRSINYDYCKGCGLCVVECPRNAMVLEEEALCARS
jgi:Pyruvate/2-oxoacid:ferredoxin oxidoreductase delta subunit